MSDQVIVFNDVITAAANLSAARTALWASETDPNAALSRLQAAQSNPNSTDTLAMAVVKASSQLESLNASSSSTYSGNSFSSTLEST